MIMFFDEIETDEIPQIDIISRTQSFFGPASPLLDSRKMGGPVYENRPQQTEMAQKIAETFQENRNLCIEAPTGVGKSFAYLAPAIYFALNKKLPVVISTETISLQEQLIDKDIPFLRKIIGIEFTAAVAKGKSNYLCLRRLSFSGGEHSHEYLPLDSMLPDVARIAKWADKTEDGSISDISFPYNKSVWEYVCCEVGNCLRQKCQFYKKCFYWKARKQWDKANILIANHALFFTDLKIKSVEDIETTLLPQYCAVILDEAHTLEDSAAQHLGMRISNFGVRSFLRKLFDPNKGKGLLLRKGEETLSLRRMVSEILESAENFFRNVGEFLLRHDENILRIRQSNFVANTLSEHLGGLSGALKKYIENQEDEDFKQELNAQLMVCEYYHESIFNFMNLNLADHVYWIESRNDNAVFVEMTAAPLNVGEVLKKTLFNGKIPVILTSATLSVSKTLNYYYSRIGFTNGESAILDSPFDFQKQVKFYIPKIPLPDEEGYFDAVCEQIEIFIRKTHGKAFVLFTSYEMMKRSVEKLRGFFHALGIKLMVQGEGMSRSLMLKEFRDDINSVIFGTSSFWMGVDVPGEALSNVIITKLPFAVPDHPLIQARAEKLEREGKKAFMDYQLPEAVLRFKQGIGRLIRSKTDKGIIVVLDRRVISKRYGKAFLDSIPPCPIDIQ